MKKITTKHGHEWMCPETMDEFLREAGEHSVLKYAIRGLTQCMCMKSASVAKGKSKDFNPSIRAGGRVVSIQAMLANISTLTPAARAALLAELQKESQ